MFDYDDTAGKQPSGKLLWRIINGIGCLFFLFAAFVNLNDHDWYLWVTIYMSTAVFLAIESFNYRSLPIVIIYANAFVFCMILAFGCHFLFKYPPDSNDMKIHFLHQEEGRELSGLAIASSWLFLILLNRLVNFNYRLSFVIVVCGLFLTLVPVGMWSVCFVSDDWRQRFPQCHNMIASQYQSHLHPTL